MPEAIRDRTIRAIGEGVFPGCVIGITRATGERDVLPYGTLRGNDDSVREDTVYDLASVTKSIPLAALAADLASEGALREEERVVHYIPELRNHFDATIEDLLRYRVYGERLSSLAHLSPETCTERILAEGFSGPASQPIYSNLPAFLLGVAIERVTGSALSVLASERYFDPLGMSCTSFATHTLHDAAPTEVTPTGEEIYGVPHDESARMFAADGRAVGHAGLFSTAGDLLAFLRYLLDKRGHIASGAERGLGWSVGEPFCMGANAGAQRFGKTGFTGTSVVCDRASGIGLVILSNRTYPKRPADAFSTESAMNHFRRDIATMVFSAR